MNNEDTMYDMPILGLNEMLNAWLRTEMDNIILKDLDNIKTFDSQLVTGTLSDSASADSAYTRVDRSAEMLEAMPIAKDQELEAERKINDGLIK